ncbi:MAG TPA: single-stranded-DNA-specific exonuclease RecJ [Candidatus Paceibacterota bacterium]|nr:single-stranded-DNA-specific exonuclease RecJ [Candidatus Paceibacterota bacterium]
MIPTIPTPAELETLLCEACGITPEEKNDFLYPEYTLGDPFLFFDMNKAVARIHDAIQNGERIGIYSDYDCDGIPGAVVLRDFFILLGKGDLVDVYIPDRHDEGYGISIQGLDALSEKGVTLMITVDVGITALAEVADAQSRGIDVIVTDHHEPLATFPAAYAVIHPARSDYPCKALCGAGVAFALVRAFLHAHGKEFGVKEGAEKWLLDLVGFATLSDMVPLVGENRVLASYGLTVMRSAGWRARRIGLSTLFMVNYLSPERVTESDLTFTVAPRLNAASRMASPMLAFDLLATNDEARAHALVSELEKINNERKLLVARIVKDAHARLAHRDLPDLVVIGDLTWRPAVLGLVATKLQETYGRSFFVWGGNGGDVLKGSCRMRDEHHAALLFQALPEGTLVNSGGHQAAGGFSVTKEKVHFLEAALNDALAGVDHEADESDTMRALPLPLAIATTRHYEVVRKFAPFGVANHEPTFLFENVSVQSTKKFGKTKEHLECVVSDATGEATAFTFFADDEVTSAMSSGEPVSFTATLEAGWKGGVRLRIKDVL